VKSDYARVVGVKTLGAVLAAAGADLACQRGDHEPDQEGAQHS
jgi:hypothetical protein